MGSVRPRLRHLGREGIATVPTVKAIDICGSNSVVECNLAKVEVAGSNPVSRSKRDTPGYPPGVVV